MNRSVQNDRAEQADQEDLNNPVASLRIVTTTPVKLQVHTGIIFSLILQSAK